MVFWRFELLDADANPLQHDGLVRDNVKDGEGLGVKGGLWASARLRTQRFGIGTLVTLASCQQSEAIP